MQSQLAFLHRDTPSMTVVEPRGLAVRSVDYYRAAQGEVAEARVNRTVHDPAGRAIAQWDPRLLEASAPANLSSILSLSDTALSTVSFDAGLSVNLFGEADQPVQSWDGRGSQRWMHYDDQLRLTALFEQAAGGEAVCAERLTYAANDPVSVDHNQCGRLTRHDDRAGTQLFPTFGLTGGLLEQTRHFLRTLEIPDWPASVDERDTWLEPGAGATTRSRFNPLGEAVEQTDAQGNRQFFSHTVAGQLREVRLQLQNDTTPKTLVSAIQYNAHGQTEREVAGNGVITMLEYAAQDARLTRLHARRGTDVLQDSHYEYDPTGNVLRINDTAVPIRYFANQRIDPVNQYVCDSLSQLIRAMGWEAGSANKGPRFSAFDDPAPRGNYYQSYHYDRGGNLLELIHEGPQKHGHRLVAAPFSNRCLPVVEGVEPGEEDFRRGFDANGNLLTLQPGQTLSWDQRNQLCEVRPVERDGAQNDSERYIYGADGMRVRKVRSTQTNARTVIAEVRYLPNLEIRTHSGTGEVLHVINVQAGRSSVRVLHWETAPPKDSANDQYRFCLSDHLGSCTLELDSDGEVISQERYHPFGTTAWFAGRGEVEASRKTVRYSGKERDATGLYYYGLRYYVAWLQRWLNPDPAGAVDGLNFLAFVTGNPISFKDVHGLTGIDISTPTPRQRELVGLDGPQRSPAKKMQQKNIPWNNSKLPNVPTTEVVSVDRKTWDRLVLADSANKFSKALLPYGSDNQVVDVWRTRGQSYSKLYSARLDERHSLEDALKEGGGNCGEFALLTYNLFRSTSRNDSVSWVKAKGVDHSFVVIGDIGNIDEIDNERKKTLVYVDAWPTFPQAHLASHGQYEIESIIASIGPGSAVEGIEIDDCFLERNSKLKFPLKSGDSRSNARLLERIKQTKPYVQWFSLSSNNVGINYGAGSSANINLLSKSYLAERISHYQEYKKAEKRL